MDEPHLAVSATFGVASAPDSALLGSRATIERKEANET
jgi:hypothetical protein